jgi:hypothetical protein
MGYVVRQVMGTHDSAMQKSPTQAMASTSLYVRLLSGDVVYEGLRPHSLAELQDEL